MGCKVRESQGKAAYKCQGKSEFLYSWLLGTLFYAKIPFLWYPLPLRLCVLWHPAATRLQQATRFQIVFFCWHLAKNVTETLNLVTFTYVLGPQTSLRYCQVASLYQMLCPYVKQSICELMNPKCWPCKILRQSLRGIFIDLVLNLELMAVEEKVEDSRLLWLLIMTVSKLRFRYALSIKSYTTNPTECLASVHRVLFTDCVCRVLAKCSLSVCQVPTGRLTRRALGEHSSYKLSGQHSVDTHQVFGGIGGVL